jgi:hypothetical protein
MQNILILDLEQRLGAVMREIVATLASGVSLVTHVEGARRRLATGLYDLAILTGLSDREGAALLAEVEAEVAGVPVILVRGLVHEPDPIAAGSFTATLEEPFSPRRFRDVVLALLAAPRLLRQRLGRRRPVNLEVTVTRIPRETPRSRMARCRVGNVSLGGAMLLVPAAQLRQLCLHDDAEVTLAGGGEPLRLQGRALVAYVDPPRGRDESARVGLRLRDLEAGSRASLEAFMASA